MTSTLNNIPESCRDECESETQNTSQRPELCKPGTQAYQAFQKCRACIVNHYSSIGLNLGIVEDLVFSGYCAMKTGSTQMQSASSVTSPGGSAAVFTTTNAGQPVTTPTSTSAAIRSSVPDEPSQGQLVTISSTTTTVATNPASSTTGNTEKDPPNRAWIAGAVLAPLSVIALVIMFVLFIFYSKTKASKPDGQGGDGSRIQLRQ